MDISKQLEFTKEVREQDRDLKALAVRDIEKVSQQARDRFIERTKSMDSAQKYDAYSNCMMSTALLLVDRWGARFIPDICDALQLEQEELESTLNETDVLECIDLEGRETGTSAADDGTKSGTGAADPGTVSEIMKRLNRVEESLHSIGQQVEAIWLKTGAVELDAESIADPEGQQDTQTGAADAGSNAGILRRLERIEDSIHNIGTQVEAIWLHTGAAMLDDEGQAK